MRTQTPKQYAKTQDPALLIDGSFPTWGPHQTYDRSKKLGDVLAFIREHKAMITIVILSFLLIWQWHVAGLATLRADKAEKDMELNAQQAIQLSQALLNAQSSRERLERDLNGYALPRAK